MEISDKEILDFVKENITIVKDMTGHIEIEKVLCSIIGDVRGDVDGNVCGDVIGDVCGDVRGNICGDVIGDVGGSVIGAVFGDVVGDVRGKKNPVEKPADNTHDDDEKPVGHDREPWQSRP